MYGELDLPSTFCWTRFGTEAGETIDAIFRRKELERQSGDGLYFWGVGNSVAPGLRELIRRSDSPEVLFSPIQSRPRAVDVRPSSVVVWRAGVTLDGDHISLPSAARVTSRQSRSPHYALVCRSERPLNPGDHGVIAFGSLRNLQSGNPLGASQVTAVVERTAVPRGRKYVVALRSTLAPPYFVRLVDPATLDVSARDWQARAA
jgi:hypothetical protein